jgi:hypothetical protein
MRRIIHHREGDVIYASQVHDYGNVVVTREANGKVVQAGIIRTSHDGLYILWSDDAASGPELSFEFLIENNPHCNFYKL